jgi:hypothetical protein
MNEHFEASLGETDRLIDVETSQHNRELALAMALQCDRSLAIVSRVLDPPIYDHEDFVAAVKAMLLGSRYAQVRILLGDPETTLRHGHRLLELGLKLSSYIEIRAPHTQHQDFSESWFIADATGYIRRQFANRYEGEANFSGAAQARIMLQQFDAMWEPARPDPNLRRLHI